MLKKYSISGYLMWKLYSEKWSIAAYNEKIEPSHKRDELFKNVVSLLRTMLNAISIWYSPHTY